MPNDTERKPPEHKTMSQDKIAAEQKAYEDRLRALKPPAFHWREGIYFYRDTNGSVVIEQRGGAYFTATIPANEWASIVAFVSAKGENAETYTAALSFHAGGQPHAE